VAIEAANILVKYHKVQANQITIVALNTPREQDISLNYKGVTLYTINAKDDYIQRIGSDYGYPNTTTTKNVDLSIYYDDQYSNPDVNHVGPANINVKQWLPKLEEALKQIELDKDKTKKKIESRNQKEIENLRKSNPSDWRLPENE
jgi:hypothetical protein